MPDDTGKGRHGRLVIEHRPDAAPLVHLRLPRKVTAQFVHASQQHPLVQTGEITVAAATEDERTPALRIATIDPGLPGLPGVAAIIHAYFAPQQQWTVALGRNAFPVGLGGLDEIQVLELINSDSERHWSPIPSDGPDDVESPSGTGNPDALRAIAEIASLPALGIAIRTLAKHPQKLGAYLPSVVTGFVNGWHRLDQAKERLRTVRDEQTHVLQRTIETEEADAIAELPSIRRALRVDIAERKIAIAHLKTELIGEEDDEERSRLASRIAQEQEALNILRQLLEDLSPEWNNRRNHSEQRDHYR